MDKPSENTVLITGGSVRVGAQIARRLHEAGMNIALHYRSSKQAAEKLQQELENSRPDSVALFQADLHDTHQLPDLVAQVKNRFGGLFALVNNASSFYPTPVGEIDEQQWHDLVGSNMKAPLFLSQAAAPLLKESGGCIVNIVDIHGMRPMKHHTVYSMAKAAKIMMVKSLARELAPKVRVNGVAPGAIAWPESGLDEETKQQILSRIALARKGDFDDIAKTVLFLIKDALYITGQVIAVDGGRTLQQ